MVPCGQCLACRINRRRKWTARILLEAAETAQSIFVTLTYMPEFCPVENIKGELVQVLKKRDLQLFIKRLREVKNVGHVRYFACGEYGSKTQRPHYHLVLFGKHATAQMQEIIRDTWGLGHVSISDLNDKRAAYVAAYTVKKMNSVNARGLHGRPPEFTTQSRKPGIGAEAAKRLAHMYYRRDAGT